MSTTTLKRPPLTIEEAVEGLAAILSKIGPGDREIAAEILKAFALDPSERGVKVCGDVLRVLCKEQAVETRPKAPVINLADLRAKRQPAAPKDSKPRKTKVKST